MDSWRVKNVCKSNNGVSYKSISSYMFKPTDHPKITEGMGSRRSLWDPASRSDHGPAGPILFESYPSTKKFLSCVEDPSGEVEVDVRGVATFKVDIFEYLNS